MSFYRKSYRPRRGGEEPEKCADPAKARARALDALSAREMTSTQLYERLCARFTEQSAAAAVAEMVELDYVNDDRYAETRAHGLLMARKSRRAAAQNLRQKGLNSQQIEQALETVYAPDENGESPELEAAAALVASRYRKKLADGQVTPATGHKFGEWTSTKDATCTETGTAFKISWFTRFSTWSSSSGVRAEKWVKSKRRRSGSTREPA